MPFPQPKIIRSHRSSVSLHVTRDGEVVVKAPILMPLFLVKKFISKHEDWIQKASAKIAARTSPKKEYREGEKFWYLGKPHRLRFTDTREISIRVDELIFPRALQFRIQKELQNWYIHQAKQIISKRVALKAREMHAEYKSLLFSDTKSKWGTCGPDNSLQFNWRLIMAPLMVLDYVVIHELAHTKEKNHSRDFWRIVQRFTPAYKQHRKWLHENEKYLKV